jgi:hypothetical protein
MEHRVEPQVRVSEEWTRFSGSTDALVQEDASIPNVQIHFWVRCSSPADLTFTVTNSLISGTLPLHSAASLSKVTVTDVCKS